MTDLEFDVLDELYFVISFEDLLTATELEDKKLLSCIKNLVSKGWVKCFQGMDIEITDKELNLDHNYKQYSYLATKKGLLAHNGN